MSTSTNPVRIGVLGCAAAASYVVLEPARLGAGITVLSIASRDPARAKEYAAQHGIPRAQSYPQLLADPDVEAVYLPLPNSMHCEWTLRALDAGKAVLCEKPLAANADEAQRMADAATVSGLPLVEAFHWRYHPLADRMIEIVSSGALGDVERVHVRFLIPRRFLQPDDIRFSHALGGGSTMDAGCYCVNLLRLLLGEPAGVRSAKAVLTAPEVDGAMTAELEFPGGRIGSFETSQLDSDDDIEISAVITGTDGRLEVLRPFAPQWGNRLTLTKRDGSTVSEELDLTASHFLQARAFAEVVRNHAPIRTPASDGVATMRVVDAVYRAAGLHPRGAGI